MPASFRLSALVGRLRRVASLASCLLLVGVGLAALAPTASAQANLLTNGDFAAGSASGWACFAGDTFVTSPVSSGSPSALAGPLSGSDDAQCSQLVSVQPSTC